MSQIQHRIAVITGGANGIGRLMSLELVRRGARVVVLDIDEQRLAAIAKELAAATPPQSGATHHTYRCDISRRQAVIDTAARIDEEVGAVDILINNAGIVSGQSLLEISPEAIERTMGVNTMSLFWTARAFLPGMLERNRGHIVTIASAAGVIGVSKLTDYCASKFAAVGFDESLRMELKRLDSDVNTTLVCPYFIDTGMFDGVRTRFPLLLPILKEEYVARRVVGAISKNKQRLIMPRMVHYVSFLRLLPVAWFDRLANWLGINISMDHFVGHGLKKCDKTDLADPHAA